MNDETDKLDEIQLELNSSDPAQIVRYVGFRYLLGMTKIFTVLHSTH